MRDPKRLDNLYEVFKIAHSKYPDLRFGQFFSNFFGWCLSNGKCSDIFFPEDDKWIEWIKEYTGIKEG